MNDRMAKLTSLLAADPNDAFILYGLATEHAKLGEVASAVDFFDRCLSADPAYHYAYYHKAKLLADHDHTGDAIAVLKAGIVAAKSAGDGKALGELSALLDQLE